MDGYIGEIRGFASNFAPRGWALCEGQLLAISSNTALFSLIGCQYGGDCRTTFALPDLRGRTMIGPGTGAGLTPRTWGQRLGGEWNQLTVSNLPAHNHTALMHVADATGANKRSPVNNYMSTDGDTEFATAPSGTSTMNPAAITVGNTGGGQDFNIMQPSLATYYIICLQGIFPSRS